MLKLEGKWIILLEGKNDSVFISEVLTRLSINENKIKIYDQDEREKMEVIRHQETVLIDRLSEKRSPYKILVKSEGGKDKVFQLYERLPEQVESEIEILILLDLDGKNLENTLKKRNEKLKDSRGLKIVITDTLDKGIFKIVEGRVVKEKGDKELRKFYMVCFSQNLEHESGIKKSGIKNDDAEDIEEKIKEFASGQEVEPFKEWYKSKLLS